ncbi:GGDEF domain-containing protein [Lacrimispora amygdalina]|uniref:GGDEF domain-containing protein n=1 Tax=Lacrimispora amygdalina TaxID=253257 RepID=A0ABQ5M9R3_9FIRM
MKKEYFKWSNELETGINIIDEQHHGLVNVINEVLQLCFRNDIIDLREIENIYMKLDAYVKKHFTDEEEIMEVNNIDVRHKKVHKLAHERFKIDVASNFSDLSQLEDPQKLGEVADYLVSWLAYHILNMDKSLVRQIEIINNGENSPSVAYEREQLVVENSSEPLLKALKSLFYLVFEKNQELTKLNRELEDKVKVRTNDLQQAYDRLEYIALRDELTGLYNRRHAIAEIEKAIAAWERYQVAFSILFIDADKFKSVNDKCGHDCGDKVLQWISTFLQENTRTGDIVCRLGGDEFLVICNHCDLNSAMKLAEKLNVKIGIFANDEINKFWSPSISIGVAEVNESCNTVSEILNQADKAMYIAKNNGQSHL